MKERAEASRVVMRSVREETCVEREVIRVRRLAIVVSCGVIGSGLVFGSANFMVLDVEAREGLSRVR